MIEFQVRKTLLCHRVHSVALLNGLILASTLTTVLVAGCADTNDVRAPQGTARSTPTTVPVPVEPAAAEQRQLHEEAELALKSQRDTTQYRARPPLPR